MSKYMQSSGHPFDQTETQSKTAPPDSLNAIAYPDEMALIQALRKGDEAAFVALLDQFDASLLRIARLYVANLAVAEEVVQETWMGVLQGLHRFEGRSALKTWIFRILINCAQKRGQRESHSIAFSALINTNSQAAEADEETEQFSPDHKVTFPRSWEHIPEDRLLSQETRLYIRRAIEALPQKQQEVIVMRDLEGWTSEEVCNFLALSETNQRVLLHRARISVRRVLEKYFYEE